MSSSFATRFFVQLRTDLRLLAWPALFAVTVIVLQLRDREPSITATAATVTQFEQLASAPLAWLARLLPFALVLLVLRADAPSNSNTASLTRPVGGSAMWCAKLAALLLTISVPVLLADLYVARITPHSAFGWLAIIASSLGNTLFLISFSAAIASLASSRRQLTVLALVLLALWMFGSEWFKELAADAISLRSRSPTLKSCATMMACALGLVSTLACWWLATVRRGPRLALSVLVSGALLSLSVGNVWPIDWLVRPPLKLESNPMLQFGKPAGSDASPGKPLWPTLRVTGLGKDEVASILAFAPIIEGKLWPGEKFLTDFRFYYDNPSRMFWLNNEHARVLMPHYASTDLWPLAESYHDPERPELARLFTDKSQVWRLRLAVHRMKRIAELPLAKVWHEPCDLPLREGLTLRLGPVNCHGEGWATTLCCGLHELRSTLLPDLDHAPIRMIKSSSIHGHTVPFNFMLVAHDTEAKENTFDFPDLADFWGGRDSSWGLLVERTNHRGSVGLHPPTARIALGLTTEEQWLRTTTVQVWVPEERGTRDFDLTPEQLKLALATD